MIDLSSDTATRPTRDMYRAMVSAPVGDEQKRSDPTVNLLCERVAELLDKQAAVFLPSGVMCNNIGILTQCDRGDEVIAAESAHVATMEGGAPAAIAGVMIRGVDGTRGQYSGSQFEAAIRRPGKKNVSVTRLAVIEQTSNRGGGSIWSLDTIGEIVELARANDIAMHMDGARLLNATVATGIRPAEFARAFDTVWIDFSKGLGCPVGAVLAGTEDLIEEAWRWKHRLGGAMRQAGVLAAAATYALDHHVERLADDHANAATLAAGLADRCGITLPMGEPETNMVFVDVEQSGITAVDLAERLHEVGVAVGVESSYRLRAVTHLDVSREDIDTAIEKFAHVLGD